LGDPRLNRRAVLLAERLGQKPSASIPNACQSWAETATAIYMVIAWRINRLMRLGRTVPELDAGLVFEPDEWRAAFILNKKPVPKKMPTLKEEIRLIAQRGGFLGRKGDGEPGARTLWLGL
jgi:hypothetical protein